MLSFGLGPYTGIHKNVGSNGMLDMTHLVSVILIFVAFWSYIQCVSEFHITDVTSFLGFLESHEEPILCPLCGCTV